MNLSFSVDENSNVVYAEIFQERFLDHGDVTTDQNALLLYRMNRTNKLFLRHQWESESSTNQITNTPISERKLLVSSLDLSEYRIVQEAILAAGSLGMWSFVDMQHSQVLAQFHPVVKSQEGDAKSAKSQKPKLDDK